MPSIKAATIPEHRAAQRRAILLAARFIILNEGLPALRFAALAERAKLARPSIYEYFKTKSEVVVALIEDEAPNWRSTVSNAMSSARSPEASLAAFVRAILELVKEGRHELAFALADGELEDEARKSIAKAHQDLFRLIIPALKQLRVVDEATNAELIGGIIMTAGQALRRDPMRRGLIELAVSFSVAGAKSAASPRGKGARPALGKPFDVATQLDRMCSEAVEKTAATFLPSGKRTQRKRS